ncbi:MAG: zf-HC2 domain-containing protein [Acidobacteriota bacterium]
MPHLDEGSLHAYLDGSCSDGERRRIEQHVSGCGRCRRRLDDAGTQSRQASALLAELEPGPIHAPPWQQLEQRAAARRRDAGGRPRTEPLWPISFLAWAASLLLAFGLGWLANFGWMASTGGFAATAALPEEVPRQAAGRAKAQEKRVGTLSEAEELLPATEPALQAGAHRRLLSRDEAASNEAEKKETGKTAAVLADRLDAARPAAPAAASQPAPTENDADRQAQKSEERAPAAADRPKSQLVQERFFNKVAGSTAQKRPAAAAEQPARELQVAGQTELAAEVPAFRGRRSRSGGLAAADRRGVTGALGFVGVQPEAAEAWLGAPLRQLSELTLLGVEVGPGNPLEGEASGRPVVRLLYEDAAGQQVTLVQQYLGVSAEVGVGGLSLGAPRAAAGERPQVGAAEPREARADQKTRDNLRPPPALTVAPSGMRVYRWRDAEGYLLSLVGPLSGDSLRSLADRVK